MNATAQQPNFQAFLSIRDLKKSFGGVTATDSVSLDVHAGDVHAIIGPNAAGKTTLMSQLSGLLPPDAGQIVFKGQDITHQSAHRRAHIGIARSFQITSVFMEMSVIDNVALAVLARSDHSFRFWTPARNLETLRQPAMAKLVTVGLGDRVNRRACDLSHGERRQLEIAMALGSAPEMLLLDEPMAGMSSDEAAHIVSILKSLSSITILLVEHDMDAVFALASRISVLAYGRVIATGKPEDIRKNPAVIRAYLGETL